MSMTDNKLKRIPLGDLTSPKLPFTTQLLEEGEQVSKQTNILIAFVSALFLLLSTFESNFLEYGILLLSLMALISLKRFEVYWGLIQKLSMAVTLISFCIFFNKESFIMSLLFFVVPLAILHQSQKKELAIVSYICLFIYNKFFLSYKSQIAASHEDFLLSQNFNTWVYLTSFLSLMLSVFLFERCNTDVPIVKITDNSINSNLTRSEEVIEELRKLVKFREDCLVTASHECRNPLSGIQNSLELADMLLMKKKPQQDVNHDKIREHVQNAKICGDVLLHYLNSILDSAKFDSNGIDINPQITDVRTIFEKVWAVCSESIKRKNLIGSLTLDPKIPLYLHLDSHRIIQVMINLITNSLKFTKKGAITIRVGWTEDDEYAGGLSPETFTPKNVKVFKKNLSVMLPKSTVLFEELNLFQPELGQDGMPVTRCRTSNSANLKHFKIQQNAYTLNLDRKKFQIPDPDRPTSYDPEEKDGYLKITIMDTGCGIDNDNLPKLFQKFSQVHDDPLKRKVGTGIGLWLCKQICESMNGSIDVRSKANFGTSFIVSIPTSVCPAIPIRSLKNLQSPGQSTENTPLLKITKQESEKPLKGILVGSDEYSRRVHKTFLEKCGCEVVCETNSEVKAYENFKLLDGEVGLVVIDSSDPSIGDMGLCKLIRETEVKNQANPCIILVIDSAGSKTPRTFSSKVEKDTQIYYNYSLKMPCSLNQIQKIVDEAANRNSFGKKLECSIENFKQVYRSKVLVIDDDAFCRGIAKNFLMNANIDVILADSGEDGIDVLKKHPSEIGCIIVDYEMPGMNGGETMVKVKEFLEQEGMREIPIFCCTGNSGQEFTNRLKENGFTDVYCKPFDWKKAVRRIKSLLG